MVAVGFCVVDLYSGPTDLAGAAASPDEAIGLAKSQNTSKCRASNWLPDEYLTRPPVLTSKFALSIDGRVD